MVLTNHQKIYHEKTSFGDLTVYENNDFRWLTLGGDNIQGIMSLRHNKKITLPVVQTLMAGLKCLNTNTITQVLNLGLGTSTIERAYAEIDNINITSVEICKLLIEVNYDYFKLDAKHTVINKGAEDFVKQQSILNNSFDYIINDIFSEQLNAQCLSQKSYYINCAKILRNNGLMTINSYCKTNNELQTQLSLISSAFQEVILIEFHDWANIIIVAANHHLATFKNLVEQQLNYTNKEVGESDIKSLYHLTF